jgi:hypothetical protein
LEEDDRPDRLGAVLDLMSDGGAVRLVIRQERDDAFDRSPRLRQIAGEYRTSMPVHVNHVDDVLDADRGYRVLTSDDEQHIEGERVRVFREGRLVEERRMPWLERSVRKISLWIQRRRLSDYD